MPALNTTQRARKSSMIGMRSSRTASPPNRRTANSQLATKSGLCCSHKVMSICSMSSARPHNKVDLIHFVASTLLPSGMLDNTLSNENRSIARKRASHLSPSQAKNSTFKRSNFKLMCGSRC